MNFINNLIKSINCPLTKFERELLHKLENCTVSDRVYQYYIKNIKNNGYDSKELCRQKLIRNIILADQAPIKEERPERLLFYFGNLSLLYMTDINEIVWLDNKTGKYDFKVDRVKMDWLNTYLCINKLKEQLHSVNGNVVIYGSDIDYGLSKYKSVVR